MALYDTDFSRAHGASDRMAGGMTMRMFTALMEMPAAPARAPRAPGMIATLGNRMFAAFADWQERRATRAALMQLTDRELDDIGLTRGEIDRTL